MADNNSIVGWVIAGGGGTLIGSLIMSVIQTLGKRGVDRATAADMATNAASRIISRLEAENANMRRAIVTISEVLDAVIEDLPSDSSEKDRLRELNHVIVLAATPVTADPSEK